MTESGALETLAVFVAEHPGTHPPRAVERACLAVMDTAGCMMLGAGAEPGRIALAAAHGWGAGAVPVPGTHARLPPRAAALVLGAAAHAHDLDDFTLVANDHPSAVLLPALLAAAHGRPVTGARLLDAYLTGLEVLFRLGAALNMGHYNRGWHTTRTLGTLGAAAAVARLTGLDADRTAAALSLATSLNAGSVGQFGTSAKPLHAGFSAEGGLTAAALAEAGATASPRALDGPTGLAALMAPDGARWQSALAGLGSGWGILEHGLGAKLYPSCGYIHRAVDAAIALHRRLGIAAPDRVAGASVSLPTHFLAILPYGVPETPAEALFSPAWCVAVALATGDNALARFTAAGIADPELRALTARVRIEPRAPLRPELNADSEDPDTVTVRLTDGRAAEESVGIAEGQPGRDLAPERFHQKLAACCRAADPAGGDARAASIADAALALPGAPDLAALTRALG